MFYSKSSTILEFIIYSKLTFCYDLHIQELKHWGNEALKCKLSIQEKLKDLRIEKGLSLQELSEQTGISRASLGNYETDDYKEISHKAIITLANFYGVTSDYLLGITENRDQHPFPADELGIDDETVDLLKSGKLNVRLICEMIKHPEFINFLC